MRQGNGNRFPPEQHPPLLMASASVIGTHPRDANSVTAAGLRASNSQNTSVWPEWIRLGMCRVVMATRSITVMEYYFYLGGLMH